LVFDSGDCHVLQCSLIIRFPVYPKLPKLAQGRVELFFGRCTRAPFRARARGVRPRHAKIRCGTRLRRDGPRTPVDLGPGHGAFERRRLRGLRDRGRHK
jgi:hypothetical protein